MFYSVQILSKKGPLGLIWIAAHLDRRLKRSEVNDTSIPSSVGECQLHELLIGGSLGSAALTGKSVMSEGGALHPLPEYALPI